ncbi:hypothetical protein LY76DRAFT_371620 [Colletotrichum caudatum]|nr:hypothetical protein LY76DRAFT_371620 [Colletotrichum caudatum]
MRRRRHPSPSLSISSPSHWPYTRNMRLCLWIADIPLSVSFGLFLSPPLTPPGLLQSPSPLSPSWPSIDGQHLVAFFTPSFIPSVLKYTHTYSYVASRYEIIVLVLIRGVGPVDGDRITMTSPARQEDDASCDDLLKDLI